MRLEDHDHASGCRIGRRRIVLRSNQIRRRAENRTNFGRMVGVVVEHPDTTLAAGELEPAVYATESGEPLDDLLRLGAGVTGSQ